MISSAGSDAVRNKSGSQSGSGNVSSETPYLTNATVRGGVGFFKAVPFVLGGAQPGMQQTV